MSALRVDLDNFGVERLELVSGEEGIGPDDFALLARLAPLLVELDQKINDGLFNPAKKQGTPAPAGA